MKLVIEITIGQNHSADAAATLTIESDRIPDADLTPLITQLVASVRAQSAESARAAKAVAPAQLAATQEN